MDLDGVEPNALSYCQALRACRVGANGDGRAAQHALALVAEMGRKGMGRDVLGILGAARYVRGSTVVQKELY